MYSRRDAGLLALGLIPFLILVALHWSTLPLLTSGDYAQYLAHADALLHRRAYTDIGYIWTPLSPFVGPRAQPPGLALTMLPVIAVFGTSLWVPKLVMVVSGAAFLLLSGWYIAKRTTIWIGVATMLLTGTALEVAYATNVPLSDLGFAALIWSVIALADAPGSWSRARTAAITLLGLAAMAYRVPGVALLPAMTVYAFFQEPRQRRAAAIPVLAWVATLLVGVLAVQAGLPLDDLFGRGTRTILMRMLKHASDYPRMILDVFLYPFASDRANDILHVVTMVLSLIGASRFLLRHRRSFLVAFVIVYVAMLLVAPVKDARYSWPLYPVAAAGFALALGWLMSRALDAIRSGPRLSGSVAACVLTAAVLVAPVLAKEASRPQPRTLLGHPDTGTLFETIRVAGRREPMRVMFINPRVLTWETGVPAMALIARPASAVLDEIANREISHVIAGDLGQRSTGSDTLRALVRLHPSRFRVEYENPSFIVYRVTNNVLAPVTTDTTVTVPSPSPSVIPGSSGER